MTVYTSLYTLSLVNIIVLQSCTNPYESLLTLLQQCSNMIGHFFIGKLLNSSYCQLLPGLACQLITVDKQPTVSTQAHVQSIEPRCTYMSTFLPTYSIKMEHTQSPKVWASIDLPLFLPTNMIIVVPLQPYTHNNFVLCVGGKREGGLQGYPLTCLLLVSSQAFYLKWNLFSETVGTCKIAYP